MTRAGALVAAVFAAGESWHSPRVVHSVRLRPAVVKRRLLAEPPPTFET
jgi:hypothetical protein